MRKSGRTCDQDEQPGRRWIRAPIASARNGLAPAKATAAGPSRVESAPNPPDKAGARTDAKPAKRFVEPYLYTDEQRAAIAATLAADDVGDDTARDIFIGAIAYDLALLQAATTDAAEQSGAHPRTPRGRPAEAGAPLPSVCAPATAANAHASAESEPEPEPKPELGSKPESKPAPAPARGASPSPAPLSDTAHRLAAALRALDHDQRRALGAALQLSDPFDRRYDQGYLDAVASELERIAQAVSTRLPAIEPVLTPVLEPALALGSGAPRPSAAARTPMPPSESASAAPTSAATAEPAVSAEPTRTNPAAPPDPAALAFIRHAANVYEQCFDNPPSLKAHAPFARVLSAIAKTTDVPVPSQVRVLRQALGRH